MTRPEIFELAWQLAERKGEKVLNINSLYTFVLQDICKRQRFWWRRLSLSFTLTPNQTTYDLSNAALFPAMANLALDEIVKFTIILSPNPYQVVELVPVFDPEAFIDMQNNTMAAAPARYTMGASSTQLLIDPPDLAYSAFLVGWAMPNPSTDSPNNAVPLIPSWGHNAIVSGLIWRIFKFAYGSQNTKTVDAQAEYEQGLQDLMAKKQFDPNYRSQLNLSEHAVRST